MAKPTHRNDAIDKLLQDRAQFISWITRLTGPSNASPPVPDAVRHHGCSRVAAAGGQRDIRD